MFNRATIGSMVKIEKLSPDAIIPTYSHPGDAGADLYSIEDASINPGSWMLISTGLAFALPVGWVGLVHPRSGLALRLGVTVLNSPGTIDSGYRGTVMVNLINHGSSPFIISKGDRIAQIVFQKFEQADFLEVDSLDTSARGSGGHGSTGGISIDG